MSRTANQPSTKLNRVFTFALAVVFAVGTARAALPVTFEENRGQLAPEVAFLSRASGYRVFLTRQAAVITSHDGRTVRVRLPGSRDTTPVGTHRLVAQTNYLIGPDPQRWKTGIANYESVTYQRIYPGVDLSWHAQGEQIEHDFLVAAGADPRRIRLAFTNAPLQLTPEGDLLAGSLRYHKPRAYQDSREVECRYVLSGQTVRFALGSYDRTQPLTIDPVLSFSTYLGGSGTDTPVATALDGAGNLYVAGNSTSLNFPVTSGAIQPVETGDQCPVSAPFGGTISGPCTDIFIAKLSPDGSTLLYATYLGGPGNDSVRAIAIGPVGNLYFAGSAGSTTWPPNLMTLGAAPGTSASFIAELSSDGSSFVYATALQIFPSSLAVDPAGAVYIMTYEPSGLPTVNAFQPTVTDPDLFRTLDSGSHWQPFVNGLPQDTFRMVGADPSNPQLIYVSSYKNGLYKTADGGAHWNSIGNGLDPQATPTSLLIDPHSSQTLYLASSGPGPVFLYKSTDGGTTWAGSAAGMYPAGSVLGLAFDPANPSTLYASDGAGFYKSTDGAATWNLVNPPVFGSQPLGRLLVDPTNSATIYATTSQNGVMKSTDGGKTWNAVNNGITPSGTTPALYLTALVIDPASPQTLYAALEDGIYKTTDGGAHWTKINSFLNVAALLVDHSRVWVGTTGVYVSQDSGATWTRTSLPHLFVSSLAADPAGGIYATTYGPPSEHAFVMKLDPTGKNIAYATYIAGSGNDFAYGLTVDPAGRAYITGQTDSPDFPLAAPLQPAFGGSWDAFISVLDPSGSRLAWSTYFGSSSAEGGFSIALDAAGNVHLAGLAAPVATSDGPMGNPFVAKIKGDGSAAIFSAILNGSSTTPPSVIGPRVAADSAGNTYIAGSALSPGLPVLNAVQPTIAGGADAYVAEFDGQSGAIQYATYLGGSGSDYTSALAVDSAGSVYVVGQTASHDFPLQHPFQRTFSNIFVARIAPTLRLNAATNAASYTATVAPGELVSLFGSSLAAGRASVTQLPLPAQLSDVQVTVNGVPAPLVYASPQQVNAQIPFETQPGPAQVQLSSSSGAATVAVNVAAVAPAIFTLNQQGTGPAAILHGTTYEVVSDTNPAAAGEIISIYCTGLGAVNPPAQTGAVPPDPPSQTVVPVQVSVGGGMAQVLYQGVAPGFPGLYQINAQIPAGTPSGAQALQITQNGIASNTVTVAVQ